MAFLRAEDLPESPEGRSHVGGLVVSWVLGLFVPLGVVGGSILVLVVGLADLLLGGVVGFLVVVVVGGVVVVVGGPIVVVGGGSGRLSEAVGCSLAAERL